MPPFNPRKVAIALIFDTEANLNAKNDTYVKGQPIFATDALGKLGMKVGDWDWETQPIESGTPFSLLDWFIHPEQAGGSGYTPFKVRIGDTNFAVSGADVVITDTRLVGAADPVVSNTAMNIEFRDADLVINAVLGVLRIKNFTLPAGEHISISVPSIIRAADSVSSLLPDITKLKAYTKPIAMGGAIYVWQRIRADIPIEFQEVTSLAGKTIVGVLSTDADYNEVGITGGSKNLTIAKTNLPAIGLDLKVITGHGFAGSSTNAAIQDAGEAALPDTGAGQTSKIVKTADMGDGAALKKLDPYTVVAFIELKPEYRIT